MIQISNEKLKATINPKGAELVSLYSIETKTEFIWDAKPEFWGKSSPVLFPIVGGLKNDTYIYEGKSYNLPRHGFARTMDFEVEKCLGESATFLLKNNAETESIYPFEFELRLIYSIVENSLELKYQVTNPSQQNIWFSLGAHPAFKCPIDPTLTYNDYYLEFNLEEDLEKWPLDDAGLVMSTPLLIEKNTRRLQLSKELFYEDALVFKNLKSNSITLKSDKNPKSLTFKFESFPYMGIWAAKNAEFVCIEPWCGIADAVNTDQKLTNKEGIIKLEAGRQFERSFSMEV
jgi:galactose mutarotase-like enzyme